ncbi:MAG TPA: hypothetical protein VHE99_06985 [Gammaproteobacteria bacterium]|nr:hypothetical protein [Gammaproteobacteria bacterium]
MRRSVIFKILIVFFSFSVYVAKADNNSPEEAGGQEQPPSIGNFALPTSQQPGPLVGFGQNIIDQNETQIFLLADDFSGVNKHAVDIAPSILYGITNNLSVWLNMPIAASYKTNQDSSSGLEDAALQFEYAFYHQDTHAFSEQATIVSNMTFPTGSSTKEPNTGFGSPSFFLGFTLNRMYVDWFVFTSHGAVLTTSNDNTKFGNQFLYQAGFGRNILDIDSKWILAWMVEADGQYTQKNKISGVTDPNSGGNIVYVTPSLWVSSKRLIVQPGVGFPVAQHLYGNQKRNNYLLLLSLGWRL